MAACAVGNLIMMLVKDNKETCKGHKGMERSNNFLYPAVWDFGTFIMKLTIIQNESGCTLNSLRSNIRPKFSCTVMAVYQ